MPEPIDQFNAEAHHALAAHSLVKLTLSQPIPGKADQPRTQSVRAVRIQDSDLWQWELQYQRQQNHLNLDAKQSADRVKELLGAVYREAFMRTTEKEFSLKHKRGEWRRVERNCEPIAIANPSHNREKNYLIPDGVPCPFLIALDVMNSVGRVRKEMQKKFRQINRYLELVNDIVPSLPSVGTLHVIDFGCGLSYLTFAVHHLLAVIHGRSVNLLGIDRNPDVIQRCRDIASQLSLSGVTFASEEISSIQSDIPLHLAISLHACDTATDDALAFAVNRNSDVILAAPCCQHELFTQISSSALDLLLRHGVLKERFAALATDALRAAALEAAGYRTQVLEFIDLEHTPKNLLLRAVRKAERGNRETASARYSNFKASLGAETLATDRIALKTEI